LTSSQSSYTRTEKFSPGTIVELNTADTTILKKIPGIGSAFASRIVKYRDLLGGYFDVKQLAEVYGIDEERYASFVPWFTVDDSFIRKLPVNTLIQDSLSRHPYISYRQARAIIQLRTQKKQLSGWDNFALLDEFTEFDKNRILPYLSFE
jgi:DNA uptake protein ComE-like DNA-binding protein